MTEDDGTHGRHDADVSTDIETVLTERVKELRTLYRVSQILGAPDGRPLDDRLRDVARMLPAGWKSPHTTVARVVVNDRSFESDGFRETSWIQTAEIGGAGPEALGRIDIVLLEAHGEPAQQQFLPEERDLLGALASAVAQAVRRDRAEQELRRSQERFQQIADPSLTQGGVRPK